MSVGARIQAVAGAAGSAVSDPLRECRAAFVIDIHPARTLSVQEAVRDELNSKLMRYDEQLGGVMLAYWQDRVVGTTARMLDIIPYVCVEVNARVLLFKPRVGTNMVGRVNMVGADHVGLLVCNAFNVSISRENIRADFRFVETAFGGDDRARLESARDRAHVISSGTDVLFTVKGMQDSEELLSLSGALLEEGTGSVAYLQQQAGAAGGEGGEAERQRRKQERRAARAAAAAEAAAPVEGAEVPQEAPPEAQAGGSRKRKGAPPAETALAEPEGQPEEAPRPRKRGGKTKYAGDKGERYRGAVAADNAA